MTQIIFPELLQRDFTSEGKNKKWVPRLCQRFCVNSKPPKNANFW